jgi:hypothetical protein
VDAFLQRHALRPLGVPERVQVLRCLELQRHRLLTYTSCGWFFDEISGIETVQILRYAARVLQLARMLGGDAGWEGEFVRRLGAAPSNVPELRDGAGVWRRHVAPAVTDLPRVVAHYAIAGPSERYGDPADVHAFRIERLAWAQGAAGEASFAVGRVRVTARLTTEQDEADVAVLHAGDGEVQCRVRAGSDPAALASAREALFREFVGHGPAGWPGALERHFGGRGYTTDDVFPDERRRLLTRLAERALGSPEGGRDRVGGVARRLLREVRSVGGPVPPELAGTARRLLARVASEELAALAAGGAVTEGIERLRELVSETRSLGIALGLDPEPVARSLGSALGRVLAALEAGPTVPAVADVLALVGLGTDLSAPPDVWAAQNALARLWRAGAERDRETLAPLMTALGFAPGAPALPRGRD